jgi:hypothetical protein
MAGGSRTADASTHLHTGKRKRVLRRRHCPGGTALLVLLCVVSLAIPGVAGVFSQLSPVQIARAPSARVAENAQIACWYFSSTEIDAKGIVLEPKAAAPVHYLENKDLSNEALNQMAKLRPGVTRASVKKTWLETGGFVPCQFLLPEKNGGPEFVAVRIEWRPAAMPERVFADRTLRGRWIKRHAPLPEPDDVAMRISRPYLAEFVLD